MRAASEADNELIELWPDAHDVTPEPSPRTGRGRSAAVVRKANPPPMGTSVVISPVDAGTEELPDAG